MSTKKSAKKFQYPQTKCLFVGGPMDGKADEVILTKVIEIESIKYVLNEINIGNSSVINLYVLETMNIADAMNALINNYVTE